MKYALLAIIFVGCSPPALGPLQQAQHGHNERLYRYENDEVICYGLGRLDGPLQCKWKTGREGEE